MNIQSFLTRFVSGLAVLMLTLSLAFTAATAPIPTWGATLAEVQSALPGDELASKPLLKWTNAIEINAQPEQVWPWVAQLGDTRGGFYSYTFIEDRVGSIFGAGSYTVDYENADRIHPEWQNPQLGESFIQGSLKIRAVEPGVYLLADAVNPEAMQWTWLWRLYPTEAGTRLVVRFLIQLPTEADNPVLTALMTAGGFVMQQRMLHGLKLRAEGGVEPPYTEAVEITLWLMTLGIGLVAARFFLFQKDWRGPLVLAVITVISLVAFTFIQPAIWIRFFLNLILGAGLIIVGRQKQLLPPTDSTPHQAGLTLKKVIQGKLP